MLWTHPRHLPAGALALLLLAVWARPVAAQDTHYWSMQNGTRGTLLGGALVAGDRDLGAGLYNPAALVRAPDAAFLSSVTKRISTLEIRGAAGAAVDAEATEATSAPSFLAGRAPFHLIDGDVIAVVFGVRRRSLLNLDGRLALAGADGGGEMRELFMSHDLYDGWYGASWAAPAGPVSVGASLFFSTVSFRRRIQGSRVAGGAATPAEAVLDDLDFSLTVRRLVGKLGVHWSRGPLSLGTTVTLPTVRLLSSKGDVSIGHSRVSSDPALPLERAGDRQAGVRADFREPLAVAWGAAADFGAVEVFVAAEWFDAVGDYVALDMAPFSGSGTALGGAAPLRESRRSVLNVGGAGIWNAWSDLSFFGSVRSDRSYRGPRQETWLGIGAYDLVHLTGGAGWEGDEMEIWLGVLHSGGSETQTIRPTPLATGSWTAPIRFRSIGFMAAFSFTL